MFIENSVGGIIITCSKSLQGPISGIWTLVNCQSCVIVVCRFADYHIQELSFSLGFGTGFNDVHFGAYSSFSVLERFPTTLSES